MNKSIEPINFSLKNLILDLWKRVARLALVISCFFSWTNAGIASTQSLQTTSVQIESELLDALIRREIQSKKQITVQDVQHFTTASRETIKAAFEDFVKSGKLTKNGHGRQTFYTLGQGQIVEKLSLDEAFQLLKPETDLEYEIVNHPEWIEGARQGVPRRGHPEGQIIYHIVEVMNNVETWCKQHNTSPENRAKLRIIALIHDTFKHKVDRTLSKTGENHHAAIAREFAERIHITDHEVLVIITHHDDAYNAWSTGNRGDWQKSNRKIESLLNTLNNFGVSLDLYNAFYWCDAKTGDKELTPYQWFQQFLHSSQKLVT